MGYISNQWLVGDRKRMRKHGPISADIAFKRSMDEWDIDHGVLVEITSTRSNGDFKHVLLGESEIIKLVQFLLADNDMYSFIVDAIASMPDREILAFERAVVTARFARDSVERES